MAWRGSGSRPLNLTRWFQLLLGIICLSMIANLQYAWTLFVSPIEGKFGWGRAALQITFSIFVLTETWLVPFEGWLVDRFGPRIVVVVGGILCALAWVMNSVAESLLLFYVSAVIGGIGAGSVYGACLGNALKWFPDRRGLAAGLAVAGFGAGSALTIIPISEMIATDGFQAAFLRFGLGQGLVVLAVGCMIRAPDRKEVDAVRQQMHMRPFERDYSPLQVLRAPAFWVMYSMFVLVGAGGLMATAQLALVAQDFDIASVPVNLLGITLPALTFALSLDRVINGLTRVTLGWISDMVGRENTMSVAFALEAAGIWTLSSFGHNPVHFVILSGLIFFAWGEVASLFPAICTDLFGTKFATVNAGLLYTAKGTASLLVPYSNVLKDYTGDWHTVFAVAAIMNATAAVLAIVVLKPMCVAHRRIDYLMKPRVAS